jgi:hypothetical protein
LFGIHAPVILNLLFIASPASVEIISKERLIYKRWRKAVKQERRSEEAKKRRKAVPFGQLIGRMVNGGMVIGKIDGENRWGQVNIYPDQVTGHMGHMCDR